EGLGEVGAEEGRYCVCPVPDVLIEPEDLGGKKVLRHQRDGREKARAFAEPFADRGVFVAEGVEPTEEELEAAEKRYHAFLAKKYSEGLSQWDKAHRPEEVDHHAKVAAVVFRRDAPWGVSARAQTTSPCPGCGERISPVLAFHQACGAIFDEERAIALGHIPAMEARAARLRLAAAESGDGDAAPADRKRARG
ncbi:MAG TPA: hypothetical protein PK569_19120, partial [Thermoanaerobaculia bacterium]|nr:hypothetical protein [Thermoanaerobaculia bacterium]